MFTNVSVNGVIFQVANMVVTENGFKVVGITSNNTAEEVMVNFSNDFGVVFEPVKAAKAAKRPTATMTISVEGESAKRGRGRPKGSKNAPKVEPVAEAIDAAEAAYFGGEDEPVAPKRGRGRPRKVVTE